MLAQAGPFSRVADLFAGSGALGIEALSRWEARATFVESQARAVRIIQQNLRAARLEQAGQVICAALPATLSRLVGPFDLVLMDPPYGVVDLPALLERLGDKSLLASNGVVVVEHHAVETLPDTINSLTVWKRRRQGDSAVTMYRMAERGGREEGAADVGGNPATG